MSKLTRYLNFLYTFVRIVINQHVDCYRLAMVIFLTNHKKQDILLISVTYSLGSLDYVYCFTLTQVENDQRTLLRTCVKLTLCVSTANCTSTNTHKYNSQNITCSLNLLVWTRSPQAVRLSWLKKAYPYPFDQQNRSDWSGLWFMIRVH